MTAEIAILNRSALALAADSAVTISVGPRSKVYDTAEKLFELSRAQPIALMIYNNVEFVGVPLDVLARKFRAEVSEKTTFGRIKDVADQFLEYLDKFDHDVAEEKRHLLFILLPHLNRIKAELDGKILTVISEVVRTGNGDELPDIAAELAGIIRDKHDNYAHKPLPGFLNSVTQTQFQTRYGDVVKQACDMAFTRKSIKVTARVLRQANRLAFKLMKSSEPSDLLTGLVFGGFGKEDMFPTLRYTEIDGVFFDQIKVLSVSEVDIDRKSVRAEVVPFAQKEMVERFVYGLDNDLDVSIKRFFNQAISEVVETIAGEKAKKLKDAAKQKVQSLFQDMMEDLRQNSRQDLLDIVYFMSKKELADIAYALVELTSQKRRFSTDEQTVGGPIDVVILTKNEGLVWIRRKHYFSPDLNPNYASRSRN